jgi:hypothetical protein
MSLNVSSETPHRFKGNSNMLSYFYFPKQSKGDLQNQFVFASFSCNKKVTKKIKSSYLARSPKNPSPGCRQPENINLIWKSFSVFAANGFSLSRLRPRGGRGERTFTYFPIKGILYKQILRFFCIFVLLKGTLPKLLLNLEESLATWLSYAPLIGIIFVNNG